MAPAEVRRNILKVVMGDRMMDLSKSSIPSRVPHGSSSDWAEDMYYEELDHEKGPFKVYLSKIAPTLMKAADEERSGPDDQQWRRASPFVVATQAIVETTRRIQIADSLARVSLQTRTMLPLGSWTNMPSKTFSSLNPRTQRHMLKRDVDSAGGSAKTSLCSHIVLNGSA